MTTKRRLRTLTRAPDGSRPVDARRPRDDRPRGRVRPGHDPDTADNEQVLRSTTSALWSVILFNNMDYQGYDN
jgi:hypothetical protein